MGKTLRSQEADGEAFHDGVKNDPTVTALKFDFLRLGLPNDTNKKQPQGTTRLAKAKARQVHESTPKSHFANSKKPLKRCSKAVSKT